MVSRRRPRVAVTRKLPDPIEARMMELFDVRLNPEDRALTRDQLVALMQSHEVLVPTVTDRITADMIAEAGPQLRLIANFGNGVDHIDVGAAIDRAIFVTNTPNVLTEDTADMTLAMILAAVRRLSEGERLVRAGAWPGWSPTWLLGQRLGGKNLGIIGLGRIGRAVARRAAAFGLNIHYHNRNRVHPDVEAALGATWWESLDQMLARMDIVTVHCPHTPATWHLLSRRRLRLLRPTAFLINTARGEVVDEDELASMLSAGELAGAALDVYEREPQVNPALLQLERVVLLPHIGSATLEARVEMGERVLINIKTVSDGHRPPDRILRSML